ncbi:hypothetical protein [Thermomonas sp.]|uniref:hypothetical protein n=1 Tax=Thermomonas sp. TaxID=1971895 RepID=UPI002602041B|nr:hypothetical protein [Thermomonas sp.]
MAFSVDAVAVAATALEVAGVDRGAALPQPASRAALRASVIGSAWLRMGFTFAMGRFFHTAPEAA